jgi:hypothetical protein
MKLKYKKAFLFTIICTMGIGLLTLSVSQVKPSLKVSVNTNDANSKERFLIDSNKSNSNKLNSIESKSSKSNSIESDSNYIESSNLVRNNLISYKSNSQFNNISVEAKLTMPRLIQIPIHYPLFDMALYTALGHRPTFETKSSQPPVYELQEGGYPEIDAFIQEYYTAKINCDIDKLKSMSTNPTAVITKEHLQILIEGIEDYKNIKCYIKKSMIEGTYIVYAFQEIKFIGIDTPAPALSSFYLVTDDQGNLKIYDNEMDEELRTYYTERKQDSDVKKLIEMTNDMGDEAKAKDEDLFYFWDVVDNY